MFFDILPLQSPPLWSKSPTFLLSLCKGSVTAGSETLVEDKTQLPFASAGRSDIAYFRSPGSSIWKWLVYTGRCKDGGVSSSSRHPRLFAYGHRHSPMLTAQSHRTWLGLATAPWSREFISKNISPEDLWKCSPTVEPPAPFKSSHPSFQQDIVPETGKDLILTH